MDGIPNDLKPKDDEDSLQPIHKALKGKLFEKRPLALRGRGSARTNGLIELAKKSKDRLAREKKAKDFDK
jgi:hypothetical protein